MFDGQDNAASLQAEQSPLPLRIEGSATDESDGPHGVVRPLLLKRRAKTVDDCVSVQVEGAGVVGHGVHDGEDRQ